MLLDDALLKVLIAFERPSYLHCLARARALTHLRPALHRLILAQLTLGTLLGGFPRLCRSRPSALGAVRSFAALHTLGSRRQGQDPRADRRGGRRAAALD